MDGTMARKRRKPEEIVAKLRHVGVLTAQGRTIAVTETTYFRWRPAMAERRLLRAAQGRGPQPCLVLRLCRGPHPRWTEIPYALRYR
jgi:hypothetical protein